MAWQAHLVVTALFAVVVVQALIIRRDRNRYAREEEGYRKQLACKDERQEQLRNAMFNRVDFLISELEEMKKL